MFRVQITLPSENYPFNYLIHLFNFLVPVAPPIFNFLFIYYFILPTAPSETASSVFGSCVFFHHNISFLSSAFLLPLFSPLMCSLNEPTPLFRTYLELFYLKREAKHSSEMLVMFYQTTRRNTPADGNRHAHRCENLKFWPRVSCLFVCLLYTLLKWADTCSHNDFP